MGGQADANRMATVMAAARERGMTPTPDDARAVVRALLDARDAHDEATAGVMRLAFSTDDSEADERDHVEAWDRVAEATLALDAAWDRARALLAGEDKGDG